MKLFGETQNKVFSHVSSDRKGACVFHQVPESPISPPFVLQVPFISPDSHKLAWLGDGW